MKRILGLVLVLGCANLSAHTIDSYQSWIAEGQPASFLLDKLQADGAQDFNNVAIVESLLHIISTKMWSYNNLIDFNK